MFANCICLLSTQKLFDLLDKKKVLHSRGDAKSTSVVKNINLFMKFNMTGNNLMSKGTQEQMIAQIILQIAIAKKDRIPH